MLNLIEIKKELIGLKSAIWRILGPPPCFITIHWLHYLLYFVSWIDEVQTEIAKPSHLLAKQSTFIKERDFTEIICDDRLIYSYVCNITETSAKVVRKMIVLWLKAAVKIDNLARIIQLLSETESTDKVLLKREIESPRESIEENLPWLCF